MNWTPEDIDRRNREVFGGSDYRGPNRTTDIVGSEHSRIDGDGSGNQVAASDALVHGAGSQGHSKATRKTTEATVSLLPEWMIEAECTKLLEEDGWRALRTDPVSDRGRGKGFGEVGMADHLYLGYNRMRRDGTVGEQILWIEFKSASGKPKKHQLAWAAKERARGALVLIAGIDFPASVDGFKSYYRYSGLARIRI